jgi:hypothetical protein
MIDGDAMLDDFTTYPPVLAKEMHISLRAVRRSVCAF